jgi:hypothetical protein
MGKSRVQVPQAGDLRRLAWTPSESTVASRR